MKFKFLIITTLLFSFSINAQNLKDEKLIEAGFQIVEFSKAENPPLAPGCKSKWNVEKKQKCTSEFIQQHVMKNFDMDLVADSGIKGKVKIMVEFVIDKTGKLGNITATGGPEILNQNAIEVIESLPDLKPGTIDGKPVNVSFKFPMSLFVPN